MYICVYIYFFVFFWDFFWGGGECHYKFLHTQAWCTLTRNTCWTSQPQSNFLLSSTFVVWIWIQCNITFLFYKKFQLLTHLIFFSLFYLMFEIKSSFFQFSISIIASYGIRCNFLNIAFDLNLNLPIFQFFDYSIFSLLFVF